MVIAQNPYARRPIEPIVVKPARQKMPAVSIALSQLVWDLAHEVPGLRKALLDWSYDEADSRGRTPPAEAANWREHDEAPASVQVPYIPENIMRASELLIDHRTKGDPYLHDPLAEHDLDSPIWSPSYEPPHGLSFQLASSGPHTQMLMAAGIGREMIPTVHAPAVIPPRELRCWLIPSEAKDLWQATGWG